MGANWGTNEKGDQWAGGNEFKQSCGVRLFLGPIKWGTNEMGDLWVGDPIRCGTNGLGSAWALTGDQWEGVGVGVYIGRRPEDVRPVAGWNLGIGRGIWSF